MEVEFKHAVFLVAVISLLIYSVTDDDCCFTFDKSSVAEYNNKLVTSKS